MKTIDFAADYEELVAGLRRKLEAAANVEKYKDDFEKIVESFKKHG